MAENTKLSIIGSFFQLETPDFAWKFVWTVQTKYKHKKVQKYKVRITQPFFELQTSEFKNQKRAKTLEEQKTEKQKKWHLHQLFPTEFSDDV